MIDSLENSGFNFVSVEVNSVIFIFLEVVKGSSGIMKPDMLESLPMIVLNLLFPAKFRSLSAKPSESCQSLRVHNFDGFDKYYQPKKKKILEFITSAHNFTEVFSNTPI